MTFKSLTYTMQKWRALIDAISSIFFSAIFHGSDRKRMIKHVSRRLNEILESRCSDPAGNAIYNCGKLRQVIVTRKQREFLQSLVFYLYYFYSLWFSHARLSPFRGVSQKEKC